MNIQSFIRQKQEGVPLTLVTAYDYLSTSWAVAAGVDGILVGDSLGNVIQGRSTTLGVTIEQMIYHTEIVFRTVEQKAENSKIAPLVIADLPFPLGHTGTDETVRLVSEIIKKTGCQAVKLEGAAEDAPIIHAMVRAGIPVMAHIGLRPQQILNLGKFSMQRAEEILLTDAAAVAQAGAFAVVLECVEPEISKKISQRLAIPTIGIGSGSSCDGQILVVSDVLGMDPAFVPKHARQYAQLGQTAIDALKQYKQDVQKRSFP